MSEPIVFISRNRIKDGRSAEFRRHYQTSLPATVTGKPGTHVQIAYQHETSTEISIVRLFPDAEALDQQIQGAHERSKATYELIEPISIEIFGTPNPSTLEKMKIIAGSGVTVAIYSQYLGGFVRWQTQGNS